MGPIVQHTTASLTINERSNCNVLEDVGLFLDTSVPEVGIFWNISYHETFFSFVFIIQRNTMYQIIHFRRT